MSDSADDVAERLGAITPVPPNETVVFNDENMPLWHPLTLNRTVANGQDHNVPGTNSRAAHPTNTLSIPDQATARAGDRTIVYQDPRGGRWTISEIMIELFAARVGLPKST